MLRLTLLSIWSGLFSTTTAYSVTVTTYADPARCGLDNGSVWAVAANGLPPYTYSWNTGATSSSIGQLPPGTYSVTVTDALGNTASASANVEALFELNTQGVFMPLQPDCSLLCMGIVEVISEDFHGTAPYTYSEPPQSILGINGYSSVCAAGSSLVTITDLNGCPGTVDLSSLITNVNNSIAVVGLITGSCTGASNGTITVTLQGGDGLSYVRMYSFNTGTEQSFFPPINTPYVISGLAPGDYTISSFVNGWDGMPYCTNPAGQFTVPEIPAPCGVVSGTVFNDADQDCLQDAGEPGLPYRILTALPGPRYGMTDAQGDFSIGMPFGSYTLAQPLVDETQLCPVAVPIPFTVNSTTPAITLDIADSSLVPHDLEITLWSTAFRPGFPFQVWGQVRNNTAYPSGTCSVLIDIPTLLGTVTPSPAGILSAGTITWELPVLGAYTVQGFGFSGTVPADITLLGEQLLFPATATNSINEVNELNNTFTLDRLITGSYDPNDKIGTANISRSTTQYFLDADAWIDYTVRFQNTGTDTAFTVVIRDTLESDLDLMSLEILGASHAFTPSFGEGRELVFTFPDILLPDSTTDLLGSQGFVAFRMKPRIGLLPGDIIENIANIYFDFNPPIITEPSVLVAEFSTGVAQENTTVITLAPNPATDEVIVTGAGMIDHVRIVASDGRTILARNPMAYRDAIEVSSLKAGAYLLIAELANGTHAREHFIILK
jgi:uncharacterized repeat protein (TIGR01451 family)